MKANDINQGRFTEHARGLGTVTEEMVRRRAGELAVISGRTPENILDSDLEQARRELTGEERVNPVPDKAEEIPEANRWEPVPINVGQKATTVPPPDEQTFAEELVEEGAEDAELDSMDEATEDQRRLDRDTEP